MPSNKIITIAAALAALTMPATAQDWPTRPPTMVVPTAAGGGTDIIGRILVPRLSELLGQPIIVENVGASTLAANRVAHARPDRYHFALGTAATHAYSQTLYRAPLCNAADDFEPVVLIAMQPLLLVTRKDFGTLSSCPRERPRRSRADRSEASRRGHRDDEHILGEG
jgi:tripartite-type tricarboxylate transporter receptor subunit TctC